MFLCLPNSASVFDSPLYVEPVPLVHFHLYRRSVLMDKVDVMKDVNKSILVQGNIKHQGSI